MMKPTLDSPPRTLMEVYKSLPEGTLAELIDNNLYMSPSPLPRHQAVLNEINFQLMVFFKKNLKGMVYIAPFDVYFDEISNAVQPDLVIVLNNNSSKVNLDGHFHGVPDIIIEILSPGSKDHDRIKKKTLYEKFGVKEYWMVDPETKLATGLTLKNQKYEPISEQIGKISSLLLNTEISF